MTTTLDINIQGREYRVACAPEEVGSLQSAAELLNARMNEIAKATKSTGERLAVMTALNLAHDLNAAHRSPADAPEIAIDDEESRRRIKSIEARLDAMLAPQETLF